MWGLKIPAFFSTGFGNLLKVENNETLPGPKVYYILAMIIIGMNRIGNCSWKKSEVWIHMFTFFFLIGGKDEYLKNWFLRMNIPKNTGTFKTFES